MNNKISNQPSSCEDFEILISAMVDGELERAELAELQSHLDLCSGCRTTISDFETINLAVAVNVESSADSSHSEQTVVKKPVAKTVRLARSGWMSAWRLIPLAAAATIVVCLAITAIPNPKPATAEQISPQQFVQPMKELHFINQQQQRDQELMLRTLKMDLRSLKLEINQLEPGSSERIKLVQQIDLMLQKVNLFEANHETHPTQ